MDRTIHSKTKAEYDTNNIKRIKQKNESELSAEMDENHKELDDMLQQDVVDIDFDFDFDKKN